MWLRKIRFPYKFEIHGNGLHISYNTELWVRKSNVKMGSQPIPAMFVVEVTMQQYFTHPFESYRLSCTAKQGASPHCSTQVFFLCRKETKAMRVCTLLETVSEDSLERIQCLC